jgi:hypothetical protein
METCGRFCNECQLEKKCYIAWKCKADLSAVYFWGKSPESKYGDILVHLLSAYY